MPLRFRHAAVAAVLAAAAVTVPVAALASGPGSPATKPGHRPATLKVKSAAGASGSAAASPLVGGKGGQAGSSLAGSSAVTMLTARLGVASSAARHALQQIGALSGKDGVDPASAAFAAIARSLGVSPARLASVLDGLKGSTAGR
jgi:hypothetical protein